MEMIPAVIFCVTFLALPDAPEKGPVRVIINFVIALGATGVAIGLMLYFGFIDTWTGGKLWW